MNCPTFTHVLVLPHLKVQNANAVSSPLTHGFPAMTAFIGVMRALERKTRAAGLDLKFCAVGAVCHDHDEQVTESGFVKSFRLARNPVGRDGKTAAIVEEGRIHLDVTLLLAVDAARWNRDAQRADLPKITEMVRSMRVAGGTVLPSVPAGTRRRSPWIADFTGASEDRAHEFRKLRTRLLPGSVLVARDDLIDQRLAQLPQQSTRLDAWLSLARVNWQYDAAANGGKGGWQSDRQKGSGWIVPIPVGYGAISALHPAGTVANARDATTPFRFVESVYSVGEWIGPHRLREPTDLLWWADTRQDEGLYRCRNDYRAPAPVDEGDDI